jgi:hypothetical protein
MPTLPATSATATVGAVLLAGAGAQFLDDAVYLVFPPAALVAPVSGILAILLTAAAARIVTRRRIGPAIARTGLAVGAASAGIGLVLAGLGPLSLLLATLTLIAGVVGAVAGRRVATA